MLIAVLPQGQFKSIFGKDGKSFNPTAYLDSVWKILTDIGAWPEEPKRGGLMLSGHSGGDVAMEDMMDKAQTPTGSAEVAGLKALFLLDTMFGPNDAKRVLAFVKFRLARDVASVSNLPDENAQVAWIQANGFRLRGAHSGGHYKPQMKQLADGIKDVARRHRQRLAGAERRARRQHRDRPANGQRRQPRRVRGREGEPAQGARDGAVTVSRRTGA